MMGNLDWFLIGCALGTLVGGTITAAVGAWMFYCAMKKLEESDNKAMIDRLFEHRAKG